MQFIEDEACDGTLDKTINIVANLPQEDNEVFIPANTPSNVTPSTPIQAQQSSQVTPSSSVRATSHIQTITTTSGQQIPSAIGTHSAAHQVHIQQVQVTCQTPH